MWGAISINRTMARACALLALALAALLFAQPAFAQDIAGGAAQTGALDKALNTISGDGRPLSLSLQILILMSLLTVLPSLVLMMTSFTRIIIVLSILRQALGLQQTPPNQVLVGLALFLSLFVMRPTLEQINARSALRRRSAARAPCFTAS
jgi:flagellar biosynthetic protein FliP